MTTVPGTHFTEEQLYDDLEIDQVYDGGFSGSSKMNQFGSEYYNKKQYDKALAWYILAAREDNPSAQNNIGALYYSGFNVPKSYLCALKWLLKSAEKNSNTTYARVIGDLFENGDGVALDIYKALEWYCHYNDDTPKNRLKNQGFHRAGTDKKKSRWELIRETKVILDAEKKKLEAKQFKTQEETEELRHLDIAYKLTDGGKDSWASIPILLSEDKQNDIKSINESVVSYEDEVLSLKKQIQLLEQKESTFKGQANELQALKQERIDSEAQMKEKVKEIISLKNDIQLLQHGRTALENQIKTRDSKTTLLESEIQELKMKNSHCEHGVDEKESRIMSLQTENQSLKREKTALEQQLKAKDNDISSLESEKHVYQTSSINQAQKIDTLNHEKQYLEQLLKSKQEVIMSLNRENQNLSTSKQTQSTANKQENNEMVETLKSLLQAKNNEMELSTANMKHVLDKEKRKNKKLQREIDMLKQTQQSHPLKTRSSNNGTVPGGNISSTDSSDNDGDSDGSYNTEDGSGYNDDINYDTPSENEDPNNDLNYDGNNQVVDKITN